MEWMSCLTVEEREQLIGYLERVQFHLTRQTLRATTSASVSRKNDDRLVTQCMDSLMRRHAWLLLWPSWRFGSG
jgi:hypothetical protein